MNSDRTCIFALKTIKNAHILFQNWVLKLEKPLLNLCLESCCGNFRWILVYKCTYIYVIWIYILVFNLRNIEEIDQSTDFGFKDRLHHKSNLGLFFDVYCRNIKNWNPGGLLWSHRQFWTNKSSLFTSLLWSSPPFSLSKRSKLESDWRPITVRVAEYLSTSNPFISGEKSSLSTNSFEQFQWCSGTGCLDWSLQSRRKVEDRNPQSSWRRVRTNFRPVIDTFITLCNSLG